MFLGKDLDAMIAFARELFCRSKYFLLQCEQVGQIMDFLECRISVDDGSFAFAPRDKGIVHGPVLGFDSGHTPHVLKTWPIAQAKRLLSTGSSYLHSQYAIDEFKKRLIETHAPPEVLSCIDCADQSRSRRHMPYSNGPDRGLWLPIGYHPAVARRLQVQAHLLSDDPFWNHLMKLSFGHAYSVRIAFPNDFRHLSNLVSK